MARVASTYVNPLIVLEIGIYDIDDDPRFRTRIEDMLNDFFCDVLP